MDQVLMKNYFDEQDRLEREELEGEAPESEVVPMHVGFGGGGGHLDEHIYVALV